MFVIGLLVLCVCLSFRCLFMYVVFWFLWFCCLVSCLCGFDLLVSCLCGFDLLVSCSLGLTVCLLVCLALTCW